MKKYFYFHCLVIFLWLQTLLFGLIGPISIIIQNSGWYFNYSQYQKEKIYVDSLKYNGSSKSGKYRSYIGYSKKQGLIIEHFGSNQKSSEELTPFFLEYEKNKKYLNVWISAHSKKAYFDTPILNNVTYFKLWLNPLLHISIFILWTVITNLSYQYFKQLLSKYDLTTKEFHKLRKEGKLDEYLKNYENNQD